MAVKIQTGIRYLTMLSLKPQQFSNKITCGRAISPRLKLKGLEGTS